MRPTRMCHIWSRQARPRHTDVIETMSASNDSVTTAIPRADLESGRGIGKHSQMAATPGSNGRCRAPVGCGNLPPGALTARRPAVARTFSPAGFAYGFRQGGEIVLVGRGGGEATLVAHQLPALRRGRGRCVYFAQVPGVRLLDGGEWADYRGRVGIDIRERRNSRTVAPRPAASTQRSHTRETSPLRRHRAARHTASPPR